MLTTLSALKVQSLSERTQTTVSAGPDPHGPTGWKWTWFPSETPDALQPLCSVPPTPSCRSDIMSWFLSDRTSGSLNSMCSAVCVFIWLVLSKLETFLMILPGVILCCPQQFREETEMLLTQRHFSEKYTILPTWTTEEARHACCSLARRRKRRVFVWPVSAPECDGVIRLTTEPLKVQTRRVWFHWTACG